MMKEVGREGNSSDDEEEDRRNLIYQNDTVKPSSNSQSFSPFHVVDEGFGASLRRRFKLNLDKFKKRAASCIARVVEQTNTPVIYLSTDAVESETGLLQSLIVVDGKTVPLVKGPARSSAEKWDALLYRHGLDGDSQVEAMLDKTICAMATVFIASSGSTFTEDIIWLRRGWASASVVMSTSARVSNQIS